MESQFLQESATTPFPFFYLPREIRDQIYRELLCSHKVCEPMDEVDVLQHYRFQVAILRCSRQTKIEAGAVFYNENCFILMELNTRELSKRFAAHAILPNIVLRHSALKHEWPPAQLPVGRLRPKALTDLRQQVAVNLRIENTTEMHDMESDRFIVTPTELLITTQLLSLPVRCQQSGAWPYTMMEFGRWACNLRFNLSGRHRIHKETIIDGLLGLGGLTNIYRVEVQGLPSTDEVQLSSLTRTSSYDIDECIARASLMEARGDRYLFSGDPEQGFLAYKSYYEGLAFLVFPRDPRGVLEEKTKRLSGINVWMNLACASYLLLTGGDKADEVAIGWLKGWYRHFKDCSVDQVAKFFLHFGIGMARKSYESEAVYFLWCAMQARPGWDLADGFADGLDRRMQCESRLHTKISFPFRTLIEPLRRQAPRIVSREEYDELTATTNIRREYALMLTGAEELVMMFKF
ncbi:MAG: hypothetical protein LQ346_006997 [Caloplaca aetnensis]|nr:MAG: hypothetical protein LQ346_006997 [Caloplaca aetnensis]